MITLDIFDDFYPYVDPKLVEQAALETLQFVSAIKGATLTIVITRDKELAKLNNQYLGIDTPTDVLSFPAGFTDPENDSPYLGDVIISYPRAEEQAKIGGHTVMDEIRLLVIHGVLHLLSYDHEKPSDKVIMWDAQEKIIRQLGLQSIKIPEFD